MMIDNVGKTIYKPPTGNGFYIPPMKMVIMVYDCFIHIRYQLLVHVKYGD